MFPSVFLLGESFLTGGVHRSPLGRVIQHRVITYGNDFNLMHLRRMGVDATRAEIWGGCIRAFVRRPGGGEEMQFFHPDTFERVY